MYCENCGKKLIRGYQFCIECGTPVPPEDAEELNDQPDESDQTGAQSSEEMPGIKPLGSEEGTLVFCPTCGMRMQKSTEFCEKCGMKLTDNGPTNGGVPLVNTDPLGGDFSGMSEHDIAQIDNFVNNSGFDGSSITYGDSFQDNNGLGGVGDFGGGNLNSEIEALNQQFANLNSTSSDMPAISAPVKEPEPKPVPQPAEPDLGTLSRRVDDFSMEAGMPETQFLSESGLPVINGGEMAEPDVPVELERHLDDINIDASEPAYSEPVAETPAYTEPAYSEPAAETPSYTEPAAETPSYTEPAYSEPAAETPAYTEPEYSEPAAETPAYTEPAYSEPAAETPAYTEPEYSEPAAETPAYTEPAYSEPAAETPAYTEPAYSEPAAETPAYTEPAYSEPVAETPAYTEPAYSEPAAETPAYTEPAYSEPAAETPAYTEPAYSEPVAETPAYTEPEYSEPAAETPAYTETAYSEPAAETPAYTEPAYTAPSKPEEPAEDAGVDLGKLIYCRNCGQDMYEKETVCKNCGSPNKWNEKPLRHSVSGGTAKEHKEPTKVFGIFPIPTVIGAGVVVAGLIALIVITTSSQNPGTDPDIVQNSVSFTSAAESDATSAPEENSDTDPVVTEPEDTQSDVSEPAVTDPISEPEDTNSDNSRSDVSEPEESTVPEESSAPENSSTPGHTTASSATSRASSAPAVVPPVTSSTKASVTSRVTTPTTSTPAVSSKPSATVSSEDKQRAKMIDAFEAISAEVGKIHVYAQATEFAIEEGKTKTFYTSAMTSTLSSGKTNAASLLKSAKPSSSELSSAYSALEKLYDLYSEYYNYVTTTSDTDSKFTSNETKKWDAFNTSVKNNFNYSKLQTKNQTEADKSRTYADIMTSASTAASNAVSQFTTVKGAVENIKSSKYDSDVMTTIYNKKTSSMLKAAGYAQLVTNYYGLLNSGVPSAYSSAKNALSTASSEADELLAVFTQAGYNDLSGFKTESNNSIKAVNNAINSINKAL